MAAQFLLGCASSNSAEKRFDQLFRVTYYYTALEADYRNSDPQPFLDGSGNVIHIGGASFKRAAEIEGSARLNDGRVINIAGKRRGQPYWARVSAKYGVDFSGCPLVPFRSAAVDPALIPLGSMLHLESTVGMRLPDGGRHDGTWYAVDVGPSIKGYRIDLFSGAGKRSMRAFQGSDIGPAATVSIRVTARRNNRLNACRGAS